MGTVYHLLVVGHLLCVVGGFGSLAYNGLYLSLARRQGAAGAGVLAVNRQVSGLAELLVYAAFLFGVAAVGASGGRWSFAQAWVAAAFALFVVAIGILHGWVRRLQRAYLALMEQVSVSTPAGGASSPEVARLSGLEKRISLGWGAFNVVVIAVVFLMAFKPGS